MSLHRLLMLPDSFANFITEACHPCTFNAHVFECKIAATGITVSWKFLLPPVSTYRSVVFMVYVLPLPSSLCSGGYRVMSPLCMISVQDYGSSLGLYGLSPVPAKKLWGGKIRARQLWFRRRFPLFFERGVLSADSLLKCLGLFHADLIMSKQGRLNVNGPVGTERTCLGDRDGDG